MEVKNKISVALRKKEKGHKIECDKSLEKKYNYAVSSKAQLSILNWIRNCVNVLWKGFKHKFTCITSWYFSSDRLVWWYFSHFAFGAD